MTSFTTVCVALESEREATKSENFPNLNFNPSFHDVVAFLVSLWNSAKPLNTLFSSVLLLFVAAWRCRAAFSKNGFTPWSSSSSRHVDNKRRREERERESWRVIPKWQKLSSKSFILARERLTHSNNFHLPCRLLNVINYSTLRALLARETWTGGQESCR